MLLVRLLGRLGLRVTVRVVFFGGFHAFTEGYGITESTREGFKVMFVHLANPGLRNPVGENVDEFINRQALGRTKGRQHRELLIVDADEVGNVGSRLHTVGLPHIASHEALLLLQCFVGTKLTDDVVQSVTDIGVVDVGHRHVGTLSLATSGEHFVGLRCSFDKGFNGAGLEVQVSATAMSVGTAVVGFQMGSTEETLDDWMLIFTIGNVESSGDLVDRNAPLDGGAHRCSFVEDGNAECKLRAGSVRRIGEKLERPDLGLVVFVRLFIEQGKDCFDTRFAVRVSVGRLGNLHGETIGEGS